MSTLEELLDATLRDPSAAARKARAAGVRVIGIVGGDIPVELILAAGALPLRLTAAGATTSAEADRYLEPSFHPLERSIAQRWLTGELDFMDSVVFTRGSDSAQRLYYYLCELQRQQRCRGPKPLLYDVSKIQRDSSAAYTRSATAGLAAALGSKPELMRASLQLRNRRRDLLRRLQRLRWADAVPPGSLVEQIARASDCCEPTVFDQSLEAWLTQPMTVPADRRLLLLGSGPADERLHRAAERAGGVIVAEVGDHLINYLAAPLTGAGEPLDAISRHYQQLAAGPRAFVSPTTPLLESLTRTRADGVIIWLLEQEEALVWDLPAQLHALRERSIPCLSLLRQHCSDDDAALHAIDRFIAGQGDRT